MRTTPFLTLLVLSGLGACVSSNVGMQREGVTLERRAVGEGGRVVYKLLPGQSGAPRVQRTETLLREKADLSILVTSINADLALRLGVQPWVGVWVKRVAESSNAAKAGLVSGDILLALDGTSLVSKQQFDEVLSEKLRPGAELGFSVSREGPAEGPRHSLDVRFTPDVSDVSETTADLVPLEYSKGIQQTTGMQVATIPPDLATEIFGENAPVTVVSGIVLGSPAYHAGVRTGDRVLGIDGAERTTLDDLRSAVRARTSGMSIPDQAFEVATTAGAQTSPAPRDDRIELSVLGPLGSHTAAVEVVDDLYENASFNFPILFDYHSDTDSSSWSFLEFIFQLGASYEGQYLSSGSREPAHSSKLSFFPLGMFEFASHPTHDEYTFLWLITFSTRS